jgi:hypothetical protein
VETTPAEIDAAAVELAAAAAPAVAILQDLVDTLATPALSDRLA